jgi:hypothetical protein
MSEAADASLERPGSAVRAAECDHSRYDGNKPLGQIEDDIARTRMRLTAAIKALGQELAPRRFLDNGAEALQDSLEPQSDLFRDQVRAYAIPLALVAAGLGWLFAVKSRNWRRQQVSSAGATPVQAAEMGETPALVPIEANVADPLAPAALADK